MDEATKARANAISFEVKKDGLSQRQSGDWCLRFTVSAIDMDQRLSSAAMGTRYQCVLVEVGDDEAPVDHEGIIRQKWKELGATRQAGVRCKDPIFWAFLEESMHFSGIHNEHRAAEAVRKHCNVDSRSELDKPGFDRQRQTWFMLDNSFHAWKVAESA